MSGAGFTGGWRRVADSLLIFCGWLVLASSAVAQPVRIVDANLEAAVRSTLGKPDGELTRLDMSQVILLEAPRKGITTLEGFEGATNLEELDLSFNQMGMVSLPGDLIHLQVLKLGGNPLTRLSGSGVLPALVRLDAPECQLVDLGFLGLMPQLQRLNLEANDLGTFALPGELPALQFLDLSFNRVRDLSFLQQLPKLITLYMDDNGLKTFAPPTPLSKLKSLSLTVSRITDLTFLGSMTNLEVLDLASNFATNYVFPGGLSRLRWLNLGENRLTNVFFQSDMTNLAALFIDDNRFLEVPALGQLSGLRQLDLGINSFVEITIPRTITNLIQLDVRSDPLAVLILPDVVATNGLAGLVRELVGKGVQVYVYPVMPSLSLTFPGADRASQLVLRGPPGVHDLLFSEDARGWSQLGMLTNKIGTATRTIFLENRSGFYRTRLP